MSEGGDETNCLELIIIHNKFLEARIFKYHMLLFEYSVGLSQFRFQISLPRVFPRNVAIIVFFS